MYNSQVLILVKSQKCFMSALCLLEPAKCIELSACLESSEDSIENMEEYLSNFVRCWTY